MTGKESLCVLSVFMVVIFLIIGFTATGMFFNAWLDLWKLEIALEILQENNIDLESIRELIEAFKPFD